MKTKLLTVCILLCVGISSTAQPLIETYPKRFISESDSVSVEYSTLKGRKFSFNIYPTMSPGTNGHPDVITYVYIGKDTLALPHKNFPYEQKTTVYVDTPSGEAKLILRYNSVNGYFSEEYMNKYMGSTQTEIPEVYELANIIWTLAPTGQTDTTLYKRGEYYERVRKHFTPYLDHPIFSKLDFPYNRDEYYDKYYDFRENSFTYEYKNGKIEKSDTYFYVRGKNWSDYKNMFGELLPLVEDFAEKSGYREFFRTNHPFYTEEINRLNTLAPVKEMWVWLEKEFPEIVNQSYKTIFSPLIGGSHSTQSFGSFRSADDSYFSESVFFICGPDRYDGDKSLTEPQKSGLMSGVLFTEIDHNYVNPTSNKYKKEIADIFEKKEIWNAPGQSYYGSSINVFNEYMTHAVFCLWVLERYEPEAAEYIIQKREEMNADRRGFIRFREFNRTLIDLKKANKEKTTADLYPLLLQWCKDQI